MLLSGTSQTPIDLGVRFFLRDQFSGQVERMKSSMQGLRGEFTAFQDNLRSARSISTSIAAGGAAMLMGMGSHIAQGADFLYMMRSVEAITDATSSQMQTLSEQAIRVGRDTMFFPKDIAEGMRFMAMAGQDALTINKTIESATNLAGATLTQVGGKMGAADILTNALKAFGWEAERSAEMSDILVLATNNANVSLNDLGNSIRYVAATSRNLRIPVQETTGLLMSLGNAGIQASMAGVATENMYRYLAMSLSEFSTKRATSAWATLGIDKSALKDSRGNLIPIVDLLGMIKSRMANMGSVDQQNVLRDIFGVRGLRAAATLINNLDEAQGFIAKLRDPANAGTAAEKMGLMMDSLQGSIWRVQSAWEGLKVGFAEATQGTLRPLLEGLASIVGGLSTIVKTPVGKFLVSFTMYAVAAITVVNTFRAAIIGLAYAFRTLNVSQANMAASVRGALAFAMGGNMAAAAAGRARNAAGASAMAANTFATFGTKATGGPRLTTIAPLTLNPKGQSAILTKNQLASRDPNFYRPTTIIGRTSAARYEKPAPKPKPTPFDSKRGRLFRQKPSLYTPPVVPVITPRVIPTKPLRLSTPVHSVATPPPYKPRPFMPPIAMLASRSVASAAAPRIAPGLIKPLTLMASKGASSILAAGPAVSSMARTGAVLATVGRGILGLFGGPGMLAIMGISIGLPMLINHLSNNTKAVDKNTSVIEDAATTAIKTEYYALLANRTVAEAVTIIASNLSKLVDDRKMDMDKVVSLLESGNLDQLVQILGQGFMGSSNPLVIEPHR